MTQFSRIDSAYERVLPYTGSALMLLGRMGTNVPNRAPITDDQAIDNGIRRGKWLLAGGLATSLLGVAAFVGPRIGPDANDIPTAESQPACVARVTDELLGSVAISQTVAARVALDRCENQVRASILNGEVPAS
jgi:hypothetical protein